MPCTESKEYDRKYEQCLDEINELTVKYSNHTAYSLLSVQGIYTSTIHIGLGFESIVITQIRSLPSG
jgi:hypothetical protein